MAEEAKVQETLPVWATDLIRKEKLGQKEVAQDTCQRLGEQEWRDYSLQSRRAGNKEAEPWRGNN